MSNLSIAVNAKNDIFIGTDGKLAFVTNETAVQQDCENALKTQLGEMIFNPTGGMPTLADVWNTRNFIKWEAAARARLLAVKGVTKILSFTFDVVGDVFSYQAKIQTVYSPALTRISGAIGS